MIDSYFAEALAGARLKLAEAKTRHDAAVSDATALSTRIADLGARQSSITLSRLSGTAKPQDAAELFAIDGDVAVLKEMLNDATLTVARLSPAAELAQVAQAEKDLRQHINDASYQALQARTRDIEILFIKSLAATFSAGQAVGKRTIGDSFACHAALRSVVTHNHLPPL